VLPSPTLARPCHRLPLLDNYALGSDASGTNTAGGARPGRGHLQHHLTLHGTPNASHLTVNDSLFLNNLAIGGDGSSGPGGQGAGGAIAVNAAVPANGPPRRTSRAASSSATRPSAGGGNGGSGRGGALANSAPPSA